MVTKSELVKRLIKVRKDIKKIRIDIKFLYTELEYQNEKMTKGFIHTDDNIFNSVRFLKNEIDKKQ